MLIFSTYHVFIIISMVFMPSISFLLELSRVLLPGRVELVGNVCPKANAKVVVHTAELLHRGDSPKT